MSHADRNIVDVFIQCNKDTYEYVTKIKSDIGKIYDYLVMTLNYKTSGEVKIYIK